MRSRRRKLIERLEDLAEELYGPASAISIDPEVGGWRARIWNAKGYQVESVWTNAGRQRAIRALLGELAHKLARRRASA